MIPTPSIELVATHLGCISTVSRLYLGCADTPSGSSVDLIRCTLHVQVMGGMPSDARKTLGRFYYPHNAQVMGAAYL